MNTPPSPPPISLRQKLLRMLLSAMLVVMIVSSFIGYSIAFRSASRAYDRTLLDTAFAVAGQIHRSEGKLTLRLPREADEVLLTDEYAQVFFRVLDAHGRDIGGNSRLPLPTALPPTNSSRLYNADIDGKPVRVVALSTERDHLPLTVLSAETQNKRNHLVREIFLAMLVPELLLIGITLILIWFGIRAGLLPLESLREQLANRSQNDLRPIIAKQTAYEIQPLIRELNTLLKKLDESMQSQRHFVSNAAHQLRTPIAALQAQLEAMLRDPDGPQRSQLTQILAAMQRLSHLVHQLLALARTDAFNTAADQHVDLPELIRSLADRFLAQAITRGLDLGFDLRPAQVDGAELLLQEAIGNLIDNAIRYTPSPGSVTVSCRSDDGGVTVRVEDSGTPIPADARHRVFERFYRLPNSSGDGCGLGLAIVHQIARQHGATVSIGISADLGGNAVDIRFPRTD